MTRYQYCIILLIQLQYIQTYQSIAWKRRQTTQRNALADEAGFSLSRRASLGLIATTLVTASSPTDAKDLKESPLENLQLGTGQWTALDRSNLQTTGRLPPSFCTYAARFLIHYDPGVYQWYTNLQDTYRLLPEDQRADKLGKAFGQLAKSTELAFDPFHDQYDQLFDLFWQSYGNFDDASRHLGILFSLLPSETQPKRKLRQLAGTTTRIQSSADKSSFTISNPDILLSDLTALLPLEYQAVPDGDGGYTVAPTLSLFEVGIDERVATATAFGPLAQEPLVREQPQFEPSTYALFGVSGAVGCALTHAVVIPLDVIKTRSQTDMAAPNNLLGCAQNILAKEGVSSLFLGAQATLAGYFWYGLSVYPSYTFFKRLLSQTLLSPDVAALQVNNVALAAGALAAVVASLGLTPIEAARIRVVADPDRYRELGLLGTLDVIAQEDATLGWKNVYAGLPSLLTRQVIFGSVKFLAFERACDFIFGLAPFLRDATVTSLAVSLLAGGFSGALSSVVSQPADSILTYVSKGERSDSNMSILEGIKTMIEQDGVGSLFRGLGSRSVWAASIIAGQFLLYDVFRTYFGVNADDLSQVFELALPTVN